VRLKVEGIDDLNIKEKESIEKSIATSNSTAVGVESDSWRQNVLLHWRELICFSASADSFFEKNQRRSSGVG